MKKNVIKILMLILIVLLVFEIPYSIYAAEIPSLMDEDLTDGVNPAKDDGGDVAKTISRPFTEIILEIVQNLLGAIQIIGGLLMVLSIAAWGLGMLLNSQPGLMADLGIGEKFGPKMGYNPNVRKQMMDYLRVLIIGSSLLFASSSIVVFVMGILLE